MVQRYRKKPVEVEALQFDGNFDDLRNWANSFPPPDTAISRNVGMSAEGFAQVYTLEGPMRISSGDYLIRGVKGEFYPCKPDIFAATYDLVESVPSSTTDAQEDR